MTAYTRAKEDEFEIRRNMLGSVLPDGRDYREEDVSEVAQRVWASELRRRVGGVSGTYRRGVGRAYYRPRILEG